MNQTDLIAKLQQGDETAFAILVDEWQHLVYNTALGIVQLEADADDITQEVFIQVFKSVGSFKGDSKLSTWLYRITVSKALDHEKKMKRKKRFGFIQHLFGMDNTDNAVSVEFNHPGVQLEEKENASALFKALKRIPDNQRIAFTLHKLEGQSYREISAIMNLSLFAVESLIGRAKANLKKELSKHYRKLHEQ